MDEQTFVTRVTELVGFSDVRQAERAIRATLATLGGQLPARERNAFANALPATFRASLGEDGYRALDRGEFYQLVGLREGVSLGFAREHAQVVCRVLGEQLPPDLCGAISQLLPESVADLFQQRPRSTPPPPPHPVPHGGEQHHTLATGKPGSRHPISEARPPGAHSHSVAEENPHGDTKLSSSEGMTQERLDDSLATAHPSPRRWISRASD
jgi:uncharacterized protein (DUF2267 family)